MRNGRKPRVPSIETVEVPIGLEPAAGDDQPGTQLPLESLEEPAEIQVRVTTELLDAPEPVAAVEEAAAPEPVVAQSVAEPVAQSVAEPVAAASFLLTTAGLPPGPSPYEPAGSIPADDPSLQMRIARIQLRTGSLTSARAQFESLSGRNLLDTAGALDLAEARWRTGDLHGAGEAAVAYLDAGGGEALGFVIAAEAAALAGRNAEARRYVDEAQLRMLTSLDSIFAGTPRKAIFAANGWGPKAEPQKTPVTESPVAVAPAAEPPAEPLPIEPATEPAVVAALSAPAAGVEPEPTPVEAVPAVTDAATTEASASDEAKRLAVESNRADAETEVTAGIALLKTGDALLAALHFGVALRMTPESAQAVLAAIGDRRDLALELVRGDALRMQGHESDAGQAYRSVASALNAARAAAEPTAEAATEPSAEAATEPPAEAAAASPSMPPVAAPADAPAEPAAPIPADAPQEPEVPALRPPEPLPPISWSD
jgi:hypothetical protein